MPSATLTIAESKDLLKLCSEGKLYEITDWIASGRSIRVAPESKTTPLKVALDLGFHSLVELLIRHETDQSEKDLALRQAVEMRRFDHVELLVAHGADPLSIPFADVLCEWNPDVVRFFLSKDADVVKGAPFADAFKYKIRTALGPYLETKRAHPELASELQEQADKALRYFCYEGNLKWVSLLLWAGANPRSKGPNMSQWSDETDTDSFTTAIEEACSKGRLDVVKLLHIDPKKDNLQELLSSAAWSCKEPILEYLLELGANPNDKPNGGSRAFERCLHHFSYATWPPNVGLVFKWKLTSDFDCLRLLVKYKARWVPDDDRDFNEVRKILFKCYPEVTTELLAILKRNDACSDETIRRLLSTPKMKSHMQKEEWHLNRLGIKGLSGEKDAKDLKTEKKTQISQALLRKYSRETLYSEVWEQPLSALCSKYGISNVALAKVCRKLLVPLPGRGYWAKKQAGLTVKARPKLPPIN